MGKVVQVVRKTTYGKERIYPANKLAKVILQLTGRKTFYESDLVIIKELGYKIDDTKES